MKKIYRFKPIFILLIALLFTSAAEAQKKAKKEKPQGKPILWESVDISSRNLTLGPGGREMLPNVSRVTFIKKDTSGSNEKYRIKDANGREWIAKVGRESQAETAAVRLVWGLGYKSEINYLVPTLTIPGAGTFTNVRLEARPKSVKRVEEWDWKENPFTDTKEMQGLKIMMALIENWDLKNSNNEIIYNKQTGRSEYVISDLGATFGKTGSLPLFWRISRSRNEPVDYANSKFIDKVDNGMVIFSYGGRMRELFDDVTVEHAQWITDLVSQYSDRQIKDAFRAANYSPEEIELLSGEFKNRVAQLQEVTGRRVAAK